MRILRLSIAAGSATHQIVGARSSGCGDRCGGSIFAREARVGINTPWDATRNQKGRSEDQAFGTAKPAFENSGSSLGAFLLTGACSRDSCGERSRKLMSTCAPLASYVIPWGSEAGIGSLDPSSTAALGL